MSENSTALWTNVRAYVSCVKTIRERVQQHADHPFDFILGDWHVGTQHRSTAWSGSRLPRYVPFGHLGYFGVNDDLRSSSKLSTTAFSIKNQPRISKVFL